MDAVNVPLEVPLAERRSARRQRHRGAHMRRLGVQGWHDPDMVDAPGSKSRPWATPVPSAVLLLVVAASALAASLGTGLRREDEVATAGFAGIGLAFLGLVLVTLAKPPVDMWPRRLYLLAQTLFVVVALALCVWLALR